MKKTLTLTLLLGLSLGAQAQTNQTINYTCDNGVKATVSYKFDGETGYPINAKVKVKKKSFTVNYDANRSDVTSSFFQSPQGHKLNADALTMVDLKNTNGIQILDQNDQFLAKECNVGNASVEIEQRPSADAVHYQCQNDKHLSVRYAFNREGLPVSALVNFKRKSFKLPINLDRSDNTGTVFTGHGYTLLPGGAVDSNNYRELDGLMLQNAQDQIVAKECAPE